MHVDKFYTTFNVSSKLCSGLELCKYILLIVSVDANAWNRGVLFCTPYCIYHFGFVSLLTIIQLQWKHLLHIIM